MWKEFNVLPLLGAYGNSCSAVKKANKGFSFGNADHILI